GARVRQERLRRLRAGDARVVGRRVARGALELRVDVRARQRPRGGEPERAARRWLEEEGRQSGCGADEAGEQDAVEAGDVRRGLGLARRAPAWALTRHCGALAGIGEAGDVQRRRVRPRSSAPGSARRVAVLAAGAHRRPTACATWMARSAVAIAN